MTNVDNNHGQPRVQQQPLVTKTATDTKKEISKVVNTLLSLIPQDAEARREITRIANDLYKYADEHAGAVGQEEFSKLLKKITPENVIAVIMKYNEDVSPNETIVEMMLDEVSSSHEDIKEALVGDGTGKNKLRGIFTVLLDRAEAVGMDDGTIKAYREQFEAQLKKEMNGAAFLRSSAKMDEIIMTVIQSINNHIDEHNRAAKEENKAPVAARAHETKAVDTINQRYNKAIKDFNNQLKSDGWAEDIADAMGRIWGKNYADAVRKDLNATKKDIDRLKAALSKGDEAFRAEFQDIFGVTYDPINITAFQDAEKTYSAVSAAKSNLDVFNNEYSLLLKDEPLSKELTTISPTGITSSMPQTYVSATKEEVYEREFNKVARLFDSAIKSDKTGQYALLGITDGKSYLEKTIELAGAKDKPIDEQYKVLQTIVKDINKSLDKEFKTLCGGKSYDSIQERYEKCYKAAYGLENDILKRVTEYNISQQKGGGAVKGAVIAAAAIGIGILTAGTGSAAIVGGTGAAAGGATGGAAVATGAVKGAATVAALSAGVEISDKYTSKEALDALRKDGVLAFLIKGAEITDWKQVATSSVVSGTMCLAFAGQSYAITNLTIKAATAAGLSTEAAGYLAAGTSTAGFIGTGLGVEYVLTGEISVQGVAFTVVMAMVSGTMQVLQVHKAAQIAKAQAEEFAANVQNARATLGIADDVELTPELLREARNAAAFMTHPDLVGNASTDLASQVNNAYKFLTTHMAEINANIVPTATPTVQANPSHIPTAEDGVIVPASHYQTSAEFLVTQVAAQPGVYCIKGGMKATDGSVSMDIYRNSNQDIVMVVENDADGNILHVETTEKAAASTALSTNEVWTTKGTEQLNGMINQTIANATAADVATTETTVSGDKTYVKQRAADGKIIKQTVTDGNITTVQYADGINTVKQVFVDGKQVGTNVVKGTHKGASVDVSGKPISEEAFSEAMSQAGAKPASATAPAEVVEIPESNGLIIPNDKAYSDSEIRMIYERIGNIDKLVEEYVNVNGEENPVQKAILEDVIHQRTEMNIDEVLKVHAENVPSPDYEPMIPFDSNYSDSEIKMIYKSVADTNELVEEYVNTKSSDLPMRKIILADIIEKRTGMNITKALVAAKNGQIAKPDIPSSVIIPFNPQPQVTAMAAAGAGPVADPSAVTGGAAEVQSSPSTYRAKLPTPDYSHTRENFPADAHQSTSKSGAAIAYTTNGQEDGIVYRDSDGQLKVPNKWDPEHPYEVSDGTNGKPASVIMIYDEAGGDFAVGDPETIASTYKNPATGELDPLYDTPAGRDNAFEIHKDEVPSAYKVVPEGTEIETKEGPRVVQKGEVVVYDTDGDPYVMPLKNFLKRQAPMAGDADSQAVYDQLQAAQKNGTDIPVELMATDGNATSPNAKTFKQT